MGFSPDSIVSPEFAVGFGSVKCRRRIFYRVSTVFPFSKFQFHPGQRDTDFFSLWPPSFTLLYKVDCKYLFPY